MKPISNRWTGIAGIVISIIYIAAAFSIPKPPGLTQDLMGSRSFPIAVGILIGLCSLAIVFQPSSDDDGQEISGVQGILRAFPYVLMLAAYILVLPWIGTVIATIALFFGMIGKIEGKYRWQDLLWAAGITIAMWLLFEFVLKISLPAGFWAR